MEEKTKIICAMPQYLYGDENRGLSNEYNALFKPLSKKFKNIVFFDTYKKNQSIFDINVDFINLSKKYLPDFVFTSIASYEIYIETLKKIKHISGAKIINWSSDDSWRYDQHTKLLSSAFDILITTYKHAHENNKLSGKQSILSNWGCPDNWIKNVTKSNDCDIDVLFIGSSYMGRKRIIKRLKKEGIKTTCFGHGWDKPPVKDHEISNYINKAKITLNFSKSRGLMKQTKARIFEITGSGGFCLTEDSNEVSNFFTDGKDIVVFENFKDLLNKIKFYLNNNIERDNIATKGNIKCMENYSTSKIINKIFDKVQNLDINKKTLNKIPEIKEIKNLPILLIIYKKLSILFLRIFFDKSKSIKASRRILFEIEWRLRKEKTYTSEGWCSNLFNYL